MKFIQTTFSTDSLRLLLVALFLCVSNAGVFAQNTGEFTLNDSPLPAPTSPVMDYAGVLDAATKSSIEKKIIEFRDRTNPRVELAVAIVQSTGDRTIDMYSLAVSRGWKIGSKADDNPSALLFIAVNDRKYFTQVSRDLEDELPDGLTGQLQRQYLVPAFRQNNYGKGISDTIDAYIRTITEKQGGLVAASPTPATRGERESGTSSFCGLVVCLIVIFIILAVIFGRGSKGGGNDRWRGGGGFGGGGGGALPFIVGTILGNALGGGRGGSSSGGGFSGGGGGDSWGGFGGGGDFGGGGAGGDW
jgi:uncharacterized protein